MLRRQQKRTAKRNVLSAVIYEYRALIAPHKKVLLPDGWATRADNPGECAAILSPARHREYYRPEK